MEQGNEKLAADWMAYARLGPDNASEQVYVDGWELVEIARENPAGAWEAIKVIVDYYPEPEYHSCNKTEAQSVVGLMAAGPLEDVLSAHGTRFIGFVETEARRDRRMARALGGVWRSGMPEEIWMRVQQAADYSYWKRTSAG